MEEDQGVAVVGETTDGFLSDIRSRPVTEEHALTALRAAAAGGVAEGCVGAGTGPGPWGSRLALEPPRGSSRSAAPLSRWRPWFRQTSRERSWSVWPCRRRGAGRHRSGCRRQGGRPLRQFLRHRGGHGCGPRRAAARGGWSSSPDRSGARGADFAGSSSDYVVTFSTGDPPSGPVDDVDLGQLFRATMDCVAESVLNSLFMAHTTVGHQAT